MSTTIIQHRYNLRSTAKRALNQPVIEEPIIKISIFMYLLNMIAYFLDACTPKVYKNLFKRQSEQDAINMQQEQEQEEEQEQEQEDKKDEEQEQEQEQEDKKDEEQEQDKEDEDQEQEQEQDKEDEDKEDEDQEQEQEQDKEDEKNIEQMESLSHTNIYGLIKIIKTYIIQKLDILNKEDINIKN